jgi:hypothetical protein
MSEFLVEQRMLRPVNDGLGSALYTACVGSIRMLHVKHSSIK